MPKQVKIPAQTVVVGTTSDPVLEPTVISTVEAFQREPEPLDPWLESILAEMRRKDPEGTVRAALREARLPTRDLWPPVVWRSMLDRLHAERPAFAAKALPTLRTLPKVWSREALARVLTVACFFGIMATTLSPEETE